MEGGGSLGGWGRVISFMMVLILALALVLPLSFPTRFVWTMQQGRPRHLRFSASFLAPSVARTASCLAPSVARMIRRARVRHAAGADSRSSSSSSAAVSAASLARSGSCLMRSTVSCAFRDAAALVSSTFLAAASAKSPAAFAAARLSDELAGCDDAYGTNRYPYRYVTYA